ncbi:hypothetical protein GA0070606_3648 [Micromonospora citrea]|uniref:Uncharacterized protein n=1 Tax=Micromonospora citrea TaxID=47855 RepID=A0A1C6V8A9_9ACTN|nr:hypothetical protein [Micromonospora citrea]SCL62591.1 hypothetical protein GA0070606_3648 [Micromonospora citrea]
MDAEAAGRPGRVPGAGEHGTPVGADDRWRTAVLAVAALAALAGGGWWWQSEAPPVGPVVTGPSASPGPRSGLAVPAQSERGATFRVDPGTGAAFRVDVVPGGPDPRSLMEGRLDEAARRGGLGSLPGAVWTSRARLDGTQGHVRQAFAEEGARHLLRYRCLGPGELLLVVDGARAADPITSACDGSVTSTEITGSGGPFRVSLTSANAEPLRVEAQLVAAP